MGHIVNLIMGSVDCEAQTCHSEKLGLFLFGSVAVQAQLVVQSIGHSVKLLFDRSELCLGSGAMYVKWRRELMEVCQCCALEQMRAGGREEAPQIPYLFIMKGLYWLEITLKSTLDAVR